MKPGWLFFIILLYSLIFSSPSIDRFHKFWF